MAGGVRDLDEDLTSFPNRTHAISEGGVAKSSRKYSFSVENLEDPGDMCPLLGFSLFLLVLSGVCHKSPKLFNMTLKFVS